MRTGGLFDALLEVGFDLGIEIEQLSVEAVQCVAQRVLAGDRARPVR
jgi:hypothetical protein